MSGTLAGNKKDVYVTLKILKKCTDAQITSFKVKTLICLTDNKNCLSYRRSTLLTDHWRISGTSKLLLDLL